MFNLSSIFDDISKQQGTPVSAAILLTVKKAGINPVTVDFYALTQPWGEGTSVAADRPGQGAPATPGSATWQHAFYPNVTWESPLGGGDYSDTLVASQEVSWFETYRWESRIVLMQCLIWVDAPRNNLGWLLRARNESLSNSAKEFFGIHGNNTDNFQPKLMVQYSAPPPLWFWVVVSVGGASVVIFSGAVIFFCMTRKRRASYSALDSHGGALDLKQIFDDPNIRIFTQNEIKLGGVIGTGASGAVFMGTLKSGQHVAVKRMNLADSLSVNEELQDALKAFVDEIRIMSNIAHPHILSIIGVALAEGGKDLILVMPLMPKGSLADVLFKEKRKFSYFDKIRIVSEIAYGMHYLHSIQPRIVHRDLKPDNVLVTADYCCKIADFGLSKMIQKYSKTMTTSGTPHYLAPEAIRKGRFSEKSDVFSYGIILWEIYAEQRPYPKIHPFRIMYRVVHESLRPTIPDTCPANYAALISDCVVENPAGRPTFKTIIERLKVIKEEQQTQDSGFILSPKILDEKTETTRSGRSKGIQTEGGHSRRKKRTKRSSKKKKNPASPTLSNSTDSEMPSESDGERSPISPIRGSGDDVIITIPEENENT